MNIVFIRDLPGQYKRGETKVVADSYANNFLIPQGYAKIATSADLASLERERTKIIANQVQTAALQKAAQAKLQQASVSLAAKANAQGKLFAAVKAADVLHQLELQSKVRLTGATLEPVTFKTLGPTTAVLRWADGTQTPITVTLTNG